MGVSLQSPAREEMESLRPMATLGSLARQRAERDPKVWESLRSYPCKRLGTGLEHLSREPKAGLEPYPLSFCSAAACRGVCRLCFHENGDAWLRVPGIKRREG